MNHPQRHPVTEPDYDHDDQQPCSLSPTMIVTVMITLPVPDHALGACVDSFGKAYTQFVNLKVRHL